MVYLAYLLDPLDATSYKLLVRHSRDGNSQVIEPRDLLSLREDVVTYEPWRIIYFFKDRGEPAPKRLVDISLLAKLAIGRPRDDFEDVPPWEIESILRRFSPGNISEDFRHHLMGARDLQSDEATRLLQLVLDALANAYGAFVSDLDATTLQREVSISHIFNQRQYRGIRVDERVVDEMLDKLENEYHSRLQKLRDSRSFRGGLFDYEYLNDFLSNESSVYLHLKGDYSVPNIIDRWYELDPLFSELRDLRKIRFAVNALLKVVDGRVDRVYPIFDCLGTVTGRVLVVEPLLQHLRKSDRGFLIADEGYTAAYLDFREFEPRILAGLSGDPELISLAESGALYESVSARYFDGRLSREQAKIVFMQMSYGASQQSIEKNIMLTLGVEQGVASEFTERFLSRLSRVRDWQQSVIASAGETRILVALGGLVRRFASSKAFTPRIERRALNHCVQGAGAAILKEAVYDIESRLRGVEVLLPMHDALLVQFEDDGDTTVEDIATVMRESCNRLLGKDLGLVLQKPFSDSVRRGSD